MRLGLTMVTRLRQTQICDVCLQEHNATKASSDMTNAALFGFVLFAICPCCRQTVPSFKAKAYLARAARWAQEASIKALREKLGWCKAQQDGECNYEACPQRQVYLVSCPLLTDEQQERE